jgi:hypothetical protein
MQRRSTSANSEADSRRSPGTWFSWPRRSSSSSRPSSASERATITFPQRSNGISSRSQNSYISRAPSTHSRAFSDPGT